jgi:hypothetical protein
VNDSPHLGRPKGVYAPFDNPSMAPFKDIFRIYSMASFLFHAVNKMLAIKYLDGIMASNQNYRQIVRRLDKENILQGERKVARSQKQRHKSLECFCTLGSSPCPYLVVMTTSAVRCRRDFDFPVVDHTYMISWGSVVALFPVINCIRKKRAATKACKCHIASHHIKINKPQS